MTAYLQFATLFYQSCLQFAESPDPFVQFDCLKPHRAKMSEITHPTIKGSRGPWSLRLHYLWALTDRWQQMAGSVRYPTCGPVRL